MAVIPRGSLRTADTQVEIADKGKVVTFDQDGHVVLAAVTDFKKGKFVLLTMRAREVELAENRLTPLPGKLPANLTTTPAKAAWLLEKLETATKESLDFPMEELWSFTNDEAKEFSSTELTQVYFGTNSLEKHLVVRIALTNDKVYFKRTKEGFEPRSEETVEDLKKAEAVRKRKLALQDLLISTLKDRIAGKDVPFPPELSEPIGLLELLAAGSDRLDQARLKEAKELMSLISDRLNLPPQGSFDHKAFHLLVQMGRFHKRTNLSVVRYSIARDYSDEVMEAARGFDVAKALESLPPEDRAVRIDCTNVDTFTIDDASTLDMDDALSFERTPTGFRLGIHITDVACLIPIDSTLDLEAQSRGSSLYLPDGNINMLPPVLSEDVLSLRPGEVRPCISCFFTLSGSFEVQKTEVAPTLIRSGRKYSYEEVDQALEDGDDRFTQLFTFAINCQTERVANGAMKVNKREVYVVVKPDGTLGLLDIDEDAPARSLIGELMVLANGVLADYAAEHRIPYIFRGQEAPDPGGEADAMRVPEGPARDYAIRSKLKRSSVSLDPIPHAGLGLPAYAQVTSPIRRYFDLVNQRQILGVLRGGDPAYSRKDLEEMMPRLELPLSGVLSANKESKRFWILLYLAENKKRESIITAVVTRLDLKTPLVELDEVYLPVFCKLREGTRLGDQVTLKILGVDPFFDSIRLEQVAG